MHALGLEPRNPREQILSLPRLTNFAIRAGEFYIMLLAGVEPATLGS